MHDGLVICPDHNLSSRGSVDICGMCHRISISLHTFCYSLCQNLCQRVRLLHPPFLVVRLNFIGKDTFDQVVVHQVPILYVNSYNFDDVIDRFLYSLINPLY